MIRDHKLKDVIITNCCVYNMLDGLTTFHGYGWYLFGISCDGLYFATGITRQRNQDVDDYGKLLITGVDEI